MAVPMFRTSSPPDLLGAVRGAVSKIGNETDRQDRNTSTRLVSSARRLFEGGRTSPLDEMRADAMAADVAHKTLLAQQLRQKMESQAAADQHRSDPVAQTQYAADVAGMDTATGTHAYKALRGVRERPLIEVDDEGNTMPDVTFAMPTLSPGQLERFQRGLATLQATRLATAPTNAEQMAQAGGHLQKQDLIEQAAREADPTKANPVLAAISGKLREPFKVGPQGQVLNEETGALDERGGVPQASIALAGRKAESERALAGERGAHAGLYRAQTGKVNREATGADEGLPAQQFKALTGAKLSELPGEVRLQWIQNHAGGMTPQQNLSALRQTARRDALVNEARLAYEAAYPKTMMGQRAAGAPDFLSFVDTYVNQKESGTRVPQPRQPKNVGPEVSGKLGGPAASSTQPAKPRTQAEYDALPKGAIFVDPDDGKTYRKP